ncbi:hypothetical protein GOBAR_AA38570 [Gossypium barbadense]|uniref:Pentatricopeptide repeat-containing protein n=1 Tax=Gossypium barbadense TaxID=3634 RepID=A0A2P5VTH9_GOSBA|nr:hypothetical protein GOBAR_AA38570 [Gossypium barbadense]
MQGNGVLADNFTYPCLLKACDSLELVKMIHTLIEKNGFLSDIFVPNALIDSYSKFGELGIKAALKMFTIMEDRDIVTWNSMIAGLLKVRQLREARKLFDEMPERDIVSWNTILDGFVKAGEMEEAFDLFQKMPQRNVVSWSTMVMGYSKAGDMDMARVLFDKMPLKTLVPWTIIISGYAEKGLAKEAASLYDQMERDGLRLDDGSIISILAACAESGLLAVGVKVHDSIKRLKFKCSVAVCNALVDMYAKCESGLLAVGVKVHDSIKRLKFKCSVAVCNALVDMYAKCGSLDKAWSVLNRMAKRDVVSWNAMLHGFAMHGHASEALQVFSRMKMEGFQPDRVTFVGVLCACTHAGLIDEGVEYFYAMEKDYGTVPQIEHYGCMVDLLGRGGRLKEAFRLVHTMPFEPNAIIWGTLLGACRLHDAVELAEKVLDLLLELDPSDPGNYSMLANIFAASGDWDSAASVRLRMRSIGIQKPSGASSIEIDNEVHEFTVFDRSHPKFDRIYQMLDRLGQDLKQVVHPKGTSLPVEVDR